MNKIRSVIQTQQPAKGWLSRLIGSHKDDPLFDEIDRLGREIRQTERLEEESQK